MARVTVEDCLTNVENRFSLVHLTANRVRQVINGSKVRVDCDNKNVVTVLREIARGIVVPTSLVAAEDDDSSLKIDIPDIK